MGKQKKIIVTTRQVRVALNALQNINEITHIAFINYQPLNAILAKKKGRLSNFHLYTNQKEIGLKLFE